MMIDWIKEFAVATITFNSFFGITLYWLPMVVCAIGYIKRTASNIRIDKKSRTSDGYYTPTDRLGDLIGRGLVSVIPVANLCAAVFDVSPELFAQFFSWIGKTFSQPLVPDSKEFKQKRDALQKNRMDRQ